MDVSAIGQLIGSIGFPIVAFIMMFYLFKDNMSKLNDTVNNNTKALTELNDYLKMRGVNDGNKE